MSVDYANLLGGARQIEEAAAKLDRVRWNGSHPYSPYGSNPPMPGYPTNAPQQSSAPEMHSYAGEIQAIFRPYSSLPEPSAYDAVTDELDAALRQINTGRGDLPGSAPQSPANEELGEIESAGGNLVTWQGHGANAFKTEVLDKLPYHCASQFMSIVALRRAVEGHKAFVQGTRDSVSGIVNATITAFDHATDCDPDDIRMALTVLAGVASVVAAIPTLGTSTIITAAVIASAASIGATAPLGEKWEGSISGSTSSAILGSMKDKVQMLYNDVTRVESEMASTMATLGSGVHANLTQFHPERPKLADLSVDQLLSDAGVGSAD